MRLFKQIFEGEQCGATDGNECHEKGKTGGFFTRYTKHECGADCASGATDAGKNGKGLGQTNAERTTRPQWSIVCDCALRKKKDRGRDTQHHAHKLRIHQRFNAVFESQADRRRRNRAEQNQASV